MIILYCHRVVPLRDVERARPHYEILLRMVDEEGELVAPGAFIPAAAPAVRSRAA